jgi:hypothetical protein
VSTLSSYSELHCDIYEFTNSAYVPESTYAPASPYAPDVYPVTTAAFYSMYNNADATYSPLFDPDIPPPPPPTETIPRNYVHNYQHEEDVKYNNGFPIYATVNKPNKTNTGYQHDAMTTSEDEESMDTQSPVKIKSIVKHKVTFNMAEQ